MDRDMETRLVEAFERIAAVLERAFPVQSWTMTTPWVPQAPAPTPAYPPSVGDPAGWPIYPKITCESNIRSTASGVQAYNAKGGMTQADGQGDDSGTRGD